MIRTEARKSVSCKEFPNDDKDEADEEENGEGTELAEDEESEVGSDIIEEEIQNPDQAKKQEFYREKRIYHKIFEKIQSKFFQISSCG